MSEMSVKAAIAQLQLMDPDERMDLKAISDREPRPATGANYRVTAQLHGDDGVTAILKVLAEHASNKKGEFIPEVEIRTRLTDRELETIRENPAVTARVHYIPADSTDPHPVPEDTINQALMAIADLLADHADGESWRAKRVQTIGGKALHRTCVMLTREWVKPHSAYPHRPNIVTPREAAETPREYLREWGIERRDIMERE